MTISVFFQAVGLLTVSAMVIACLGAGYMAAVSSRRVPDARPTPVPGRLYLVPAGDELAARRAMRRAPDLRPPTTGRPPAA